MHKKWRLTHIERARASGNEWQKTHPEKVREKSRRYSLLHPEKIKEKHRRYYSAYIYSNAIYLTRREQVKAYYKIYWQTPRGKEVTKKHKSKRKGLGFIPLNEYFKSSHGHHIDKERVIYIPEKLHNSIGHSVLQNRNMAIINAVAYKYLTVLPEKSQYVCGHGI